MVASSSAALASACAASATASAASATTSASASSSASSSASVPGGSDGEEAAADEALLGRLLAGFQTYSRWLAEVAGSTGALTRRVAAQRGSELPDVQHTPTLSAAGLAAFRSAVVLHPAIEAPLARHISRCSASLLRRGGWRTAESGTRDQPEITRDHPRLGTAGGRPSRVG